MTFYPRSYWVHLWGPSTAFVSATFFVAGTKHLVSSNFGEEEFSLDHSLKKHSSSWRIRHASRQLCGGRKVQLGCFISSHLSGKGWKEREQEVRLDCRTSNPTGPLLLASFYSCFTTFQNNIMSWEQSYQTFESMGDISHSNTATFILKCILHFRLQRTLLWLVEFRKS